MCNRDVLFIRPFDWLLASFDKFTTVWCLSMFSYTYCMMNKNHTRYFMMCDLVRLRLRVVTN